MTGFKKMEKTKMMLALVRLTASHSLVGLYAAQSIPHMRNLVDETSTASHCEYAEIDAAGFAAARAHDGGTAFRPSADLEMSLDALAELDWQPLDPECQSEGSQLDRLLDTSAGRAAIAEAFAKSTSISLA